MEISSYWNRRKKAIIGNKMKYALSEEFSDLFIKLRNKRKYPPRKKQYRKTPFDYTLHIIFKFSCTVKVQVISLQLNWIADLSAM